MRTIQGYPLLLLKSHGHKHSRQTLLHPITHLPTWIKIHKGTQTEHNLLAVFPPVKARLVHDIPSSQKKPRKRATDRLLKYSR